MRPKIGETYRHFKGGKYYVLGYALDSETQEEMIIYKSFRDGKVWARPLKEFTGIHSSGVKRFVKE